MQQGTYVIANDLLGVVVSASDHTVHIVDKSGTERSIMKSACHEICNPHALAALMYNKVVKKLNIQTDGCEGGQFVDFT